MLLSTTVRRSHGIEAFPGCCKAATQTALADYTGIGSMRDTNLKSFRVE